MKKIFTLVLSLMVAGAMSAQTVSVKDAAQKAAGIFNKANAARSMNGTTKSAEPQLAYTAELKGVTCFYAFNNPQGGFAIIGGDKASHEVLAVVDNGSFDVNTLPDAAKFMLSQYANEIVSAKKAGIVSKLSEEGNLQDVENICPTVWDQQKYYNNLTPEYSAGNHCLTGCVATAAAQVLLGAYIKAASAGLNFPTTGVRSITYTHQVKDANGTLVGTQALTYDKDKAFDWANMKFAYVDGATTYSDAEVEAVAYLMKAMGVMAKMEYGGNLSLACTSDICKGLSNGLGLQVKMANKSKMTDDDWMTLILKELIAGRPVLYTGSATTSTQPCGHAFLVDGFQASTNLFHINWGWSSVADGYYALNAATAKAEKGEQSWLFPTTQGSGSTDSDYRGDNDIIYNFVYDPGNIPAYQPDAQATGVDMTQGAEASSARLTVENDATDALKVFTVDKPITVNFAGDGVENVGEEAKFVWGIELEPVYETGKEPDVIECYLLAADKTGKDIEDFEVGEKVKSFTVTLSDYEWGTDTVGGKIPYGNYQVTPVMFYDADGDESYEITDEDVSYISMGYNWKAPMFNFQAGEPTAIKNVETTAPAVKAGRKTIVNNRVVILKNDKQFNAAGQLMK